MLPRSRGRQASTSSRRRNDASKPNASLANGTPRTRDNVIALPPYRGFGPRMNGGVTAYGFVGLIGLYGLP